MDSFKLDCAAAARFAAALATTMMATKAKAVARDEHARIGRRAALVLSSRMDLLLCLSVRRPCSNANRVSSRKHLASITLGASIQQAVATNKQTNRQPKSEREKETRLTHSQ